MNEPVAVVGLACRFPGAPDADALWRLLIEERDGLTHFSDDELIRAGVPAQLRRNRHYVPVGGLLSEQDHFDPAPFGIGAREAEILDPQQRLFLESAWHALEDAGHGGTRNAGVAGVFAGSALSAYLITNLAGRFDPSGGADPADSLELHGANVADYLPLRTAYRLGATGPAVSVGATCATSLAAVHLAVQALLNEECDTAIAGGVSLRVPQGRGYLYVPDGPFSRDGHTRPYAADASGTVFTQGVGAVVLRRLSDAQRDGDPIRAVILGSALGNDGAERVGFTAPSVTGQARTIAEALGVADVDATDISYLEGHGTATPLGDPIEVSALRRVFGAAVRPWCGLGSVKGNLGHADSAAGIAGLIKTILALQHRTLPASRFARQPNPDLELSGSAFRLVAETEPWEPVNGGRRAGVSSFGIGGVDCHVVLGEAPVAATRGSDGRAQLLLVSAATDQACRATAQRLADRLAESRPGDHLADVAHTLATGRAELPVRVAVTVRPDQGAAEALRQATPVARNPGFDTRVVFAFPGGDAQYAGMGRGLYAEEPVFAAAVDEISATLYRLTGDDPRQVVLADPTDPSARAAARSPRTGLPASFTTSVAMATLLEHYHVRPDMVLGHSVGEYAAAVVAGVLSASQTAELVAERSVRLAVLPAGAMLAAEITESDALALLAEHPDLDLAAVNAPDACVLSGPRAAVDAVAGRLAAAGKQSRLLSIDTPAHSRLVEPIMPPLRTVASRLTPKPPMVPLVTTITGEVATAEDLADPDRWARHLRSTVRFAAALRTALADGPAIVLQVGPGAGIASLAARAGRDAVPAALTTVTDPREVAETSGAGATRDAFLAALGQLWCHGVPLDTEALGRGERRRLSLPGYAFQRERFWIEPPARRRTGGVLGPDTAEPDATEPLQVPTWRQLPPLRADLGGLAGTRWLVWGERVPEFETALHEVGADIVAPESHVPADRLDGVLWTVPPLAEPSSGGEAALATRVRADVLAAGRLASLIATDATSAPVILQVTAAGEQVTGTERIDPVASAARGLVRVLAQEVPDVRWRVLDLPAWPGVVDDGADGVGTVRAEAADLLAGGSGWELASRGGRRWIREWEPWRPVPGGAEPLREPVVMITGGLGNVGLALARRLITDHSARVVLAGRSGEPDPGATEPRLVRRREALRELRAGGGQVRVEVLDTTDPEAVRSLLSRVTAEWDRIDLFVHAPVVIELTPLSDLDESSLDEVLAPKVSGTLALRVAVDGMAATERPRVVLLMSSAAGTVGGFGLSPYVAASRFMDAVAITATGGNDARWLALDSDRWRFDTADERESVSEITMRNALDADDAVTALLRLAGLAATGVCPPQVAVSPGDLNARSLTLGTRTVRAETGMDGSLVTDAERTVAALWSEVLGRPVIDSGDDFFALGGHSLLATRVLAALRDRHGLQISLRELLAHSTVAALASLVAARQPHHVPAAPAPVAVAMTSDPFPLTRVQHAYWIGRTGAFTLGEVGCHFYYEHDTTDLDVDRYERAWNRLIARHEMLRAVVTDEGQNLVLDRVPTYRIPVVDCREATPQRQAEALRELRERLSHRVAAPGRWPLVEVHVVLLPEGAARVALSVDVLMCDSASYMIIDRELATLYRNPDAELPPIGVTFADCVAALNERTRSDSYRRASAYWLGRLDTLPGAPALPAREPSGAPRFGRRRAELPPDRWRRLRQRAAASGVSPTAVLLSAYADTLAEWSGDERFSVTVTVFDRPEIHPNVNRVVGEFSSLLLLEAAPDRGESFAGRVRSVQRQLFADLDHREYSGLELLAERARRSGEQVNIPVVFTGMLGLDRLDGAASHEHDWLGPVVYGVSQTPQVWLDHQAFELRDSLVLQWDVNEQVLDPALADAAFDGYVRRLTLAADSDAAWQSPPNVDSESGSGEKPGSGATEAALAEVWGELLGVEPASIPPEASFLNLGGDSLLAVRMAARIRQRLGVGLPLPQIRPTLTIRELAGLVRAQPTGAAVRTGTDIRLRRRIDRESPFPLLPLQSAYFVGQHGGWELSYPSVHVYTDIRLSEVDAERAVGALDDALRRVVAHQPMLRARLLPDGTQRILDVEDPSLYRPVQALDLRSAAPEEVDRAVTALRAEMSRTGPNPTSGPGYEARLTFLPERRGLLHLSLSLLTCDGWGGAVLHREMFTYVADPNTVLPPLLVDFGDYVTAMAQIRRTSESEADRDWWWHRLPGLPAAPSIPTVVDPYQVDPPLMGVRESRLDGGRWARLRELCAQYNVTPATALLTAFGVALSRLTGERRFLLNTLQFNRMPLHPDVDRMVGPFSTTTLVVVDLTRGTTFTELAAATQAEVSESLAHNLVTGVEVVRELGRLRGTKRAVAPVVFQSTLGLDNAVGGELPLRAGPLGELHIGDYYQQVRTPQIWLECRVFELRSELVINFALVDELFAPGVVDGLVADVTALTHSLLADEGWNRPVDLPAEVAVVEGRLAEHGAATVEASGPPTDDLERELADVWSEVLGSDACDAVAVDRAADFFSLGGDSLLAVRMLGRVAARFGGPMPPRDFLRAPTLAGLARILRSRETTTPADTVPTDVASEAATSIGHRAATTRPMLADIAVPLRDGTGTPLFLLHPSGGDVICYAELARALSVDNPVIALTDPVLADPALPGPPDIPTVVRQYIDVIQAWQPVGPYLLGGWSMGGTVAHEMAVELRRRGEPITQLVMIDSNSPNRIIAQEGLDRPRARAELWRRYLRSVAAFLGTDLPDDVGDLETLLRQHGVLGRDEPTIARRFEVFTRHLDALAGHTAHPLDDTVPVLLLRAGRTAPSNTRVGMGVDDAFDEVDLGWGPFVAGPMAIKVVDAHHYSMLRSPALSAVARHIDTTLARVRDSAA
ncbi:type I polyketide synthase [Micromonospora sp. WMMD1082]|uniref:type I polyketide synthase n=1 Tax=Micromonospora sp. WMMD1082 TaxID=3016104 RepID=UPI002417F102|nr:type I polyketide synthase [Micromonospora sp. WMMD1082]MDG4795592.1 SDR family NAD(P)-dependent oxidoreductase [Micromonospora sp. WMMD1082]